MKTVMVEGVECVVWKDSSDTPKPPILEALATGEQIELRQKVGAPRACLLCPLLHKSARWINERSREGKCKERCAVGGSGADIFIPAKWVPILRMRGVPEDDFR